MPALPTRRILFALLATLALHVGCVGVQTNAAMDFESFPPESIAGETRFPLTLQVAVRATGVAADNQLRATLSDDVRGAFTFHLNQTRRVKPAEGEPAYRANVAVLDEGGDSASVGAAVFTVLTFYLVPSWTTHRYTTTVELFDPEGRKLGTRRYHHQLRLVQQLFLVFWMPFSGLQQSYDEMWNEVMRDAAVWTVELADAAAR